MTLVALKGFLFAQPYTVPTGTGIPAVSSVARFDPQSGERVAASVPLYPGRLATAGATLWLAARTDFSSVGGGAFTVYELDLTSLATRRTMALPRPKETDATAPIAGTPEGTLWVGNGSTLRRIDTTHGVVLYKITTAGNLGDVSLGGNRLYDSLQEPSGLVVVEQRDAATGRLQASRAIPQAIAGAAVVASSTGVWVSYRGGMQGSTHLLESGSLADGPEPPGAQPDGPDSNLYGGTMGSSATISGGVLWVTRIAHLTCADPGSGAVRATEALPGIMFIGEPVAIGHELFAEGTDAAGQMFGSVQVITPPSACWSS